MTTLYKPVLIESAELPMDKFPTGTVATHPDHWPVERCSCSRWESDGPDRYDSDMVGWTALVPIEAEEEYSAERAGLAWDNDDIYSSPEDVRRDGWTDPLQRRYTTRWDEA